MCNHYDLVGLRPKLVQWAGKFVKGKENREDLTQMTLIRAIEIISRTDKEIPAIEPWLRNVMKYEFLNGRRKNAFVDDYLKEEIHEFLEKPPQWMPMPQFDYVYFCEVMREIDKLPRDLRRLLLFSADGASIEELADATKLSRQGAWMLLGRARAMLERRGITKFSHD